jgi:hypothetical protein
VVRERLERKLRLGCRHRNALHRWELASIVLTLEAELMTYFSSK